MNTKKSVTDSDADRTKKAKEIFGQFEQKGFDLKRIERERWDLAKELAVLAYPEKCAYHDKQVKDEERFNRIPNTFIGMFRIQGKTYKICAEGKTYFIFESK